MHPPLTDVEVRVLGSLVEKEATTPDVYPLSLSGLVAACNQLSNREPVMQLGEDAVGEAVVSLRRRGLLRAIQPAGSRVMKYQHLLVDALGLDRRQLALLAVLMLRGPQTSGELNARTGRLAKFGDLAELEMVLESLMAREPEPLIARLPRRAGQKESRYAHLLTGSAAEADAREEARTTATLSPVRAEDDDRVTALEAAVAQLRAELAALRTELAEFRAQFQ